MFPATQSYDQLQQYINTFASNAQSILGVVPLGFSCVIDASVMQILIGNYKKL